MTRIALYSLLLIAGMVSSQLFELQSLQPHLGAVTMICLSYIMIEVGLEFVLNKNNLVSYVWDYLVAMTAAAFPWIFCTLYFYYITDTGFIEALVIGRFAAPTSAGVLFAMLAAAGLGTTWLFKKARILAIFDDLDTILLMIPLQMMIVGFKREVFVLLSIILILFYIAFKYLHKLKIPTSRIWLLYYSILVVGVCQIVEETIHVQFEVLLPAFALGCIIYNPHDPTRPEKHAYEHAYIEPKEMPWKWVDIIVKNFFMFLVGASLPKMHFGTMGIGIVVGHVAALTILSNIGKMFPSLCYKKEASLRERIALSVSLFPRGEVGAGVLLLSLEYGLNENAIILGSMSLALNLLLTGVFILTVIRLIQPQKKL